MMDIYLHGRAERISPEAPVPVVLEEKALERPGGAGNVARNLTSLGARVMLAGVLGRDAVGRRLIKRLKSEGTDCTGLICSANRVTTRKTRIVSGSQQLLRIDREEIVPVEGDDLEQIISFLKKITTGIDGVVISDYAKGMIHPGLMEFINSRYRSDALPVVVDPKPRNSAYFNKISVLKPNLRELEQLAGKKFGNAGEIESFCRALAARQKCGAVLVTLGREGMFLVEEGGPATAIPGKKCPVYDVSGAGDTVTAVLTLCLCAGCSYLEAACIANTAASLVVSRPGTAVLSAEELVLALNS